MVTIDREPPNGKLPPSTKRSLRLHGMLMHVAAKSVDETISSEQGANAMFRRRMTQGNHMKLVADSSRIPLLLQSTSRLSGQDTIREAQEGKVSRNVPTVSLDSRHGSKLADALWSMESNGVVLDQKPNCTALHKDEKPDAADEFLKVSNMTPAERIRYFFLKYRELAAMSQQDKEAIEEQIRQIILERLGLENEDGKSGEDAVTPAPEEDSVPSDARS
ncbi:hypothetical protein FHS21_004876 [Phyllobacterium trifolii]|uniref:Uncharacterized protein n=1 Tax=Phyllobacterium trifolii TaxID=300193 RepID=A0A839UIR4_9HYPH|nr:hypothetical protein [Phyllobacterium trifolii]MBB3148429.1 hypothetical protein [Phyllobacterium trifolii]